MKEGQPFLGRDMGHTPDYSAKVANQIDLELHSLIEEELEVLVEKDDVLEDLAQTRLDVESLDRESLQEVLAPVRERPSRALEAMHGGAREGDPASPATMGRWTPAPGSGGNGQGKGGAQGAGDGAGGTKVRRVVRSPRNPDEADS